MSGAITLDQFSIGLSDPNYALGVMIANNPEAIADNLNNNGFIVSDHQGIADALNEILDRKDYALFKQVLSVPIRLDRMGPEEVNIVTTQAAAMTRAAGGSAKSFDLNAAFGGLATGVLTYLAATGTTAVDPNGAKAPPKPPEKDNTMLYVGIGVGAVLLIILLFIGLKKGK